MGQNNTNNNSSPAIRGSHKVRSAATQLKVLEAGIEILSEKGYHGASTSVVAKRAGVSRGALLHQFPTHSDLMFAIVQHVVVKQRDRNRSLLKNLSSEIEQFKYLTEALWHWSKLPETMALIEIHLAARSVPELAKGSGWRINELIQSEIEDTWKLAQRAGINDKSAVNALGTLTIASIWGLSILRLKLWEKDEIDKAYQLLKTNLESFVHTHIKSIA